MNRILVKSSTIRSIGFDDGMLEVEFKSGGLYQYLNVTKSTYDELMNSPSKGKYFDQKIKNIYKTVKLK